MTAAAASARPEGTITPAWLGGDHQSGADAFGGVQFGYNFQSPGAFVYGIEVDLGGMSLNGRGHAVAAPTIPIAPETSPGTVRQSPSTERAKAASTAT